MKRIGKILSIGVSLLLAGGMVFANGNKEAAPAAAAPAAAASQGAFNWKSQAGKELTVYMVEHQTSSAIVKQLQKFEDLTGIKVNQSITPEANYFDKLNPGLSSHSGTPDLYMSGAYQLWTYQQAGNVEDLTPWLNGKMGPVDPNYDQADFIPSVFNALKWDGKNGDKVGTGAQLAIPLGCELYMLAYNQKAFDKAGIKEAPKTLDDLMADVKKIAAIKGGWNGPGSYAIAVRGARDWGTIHPAYMSTYTMWGAKDFEMQNGKLVSAVNSPESVAMNTYWVNMIKAGGSPQWSNQYWYMCLADFGAGKAAILWDASNCECQVDFQNMAEKGNIRYTVMPTPKAGQKVQSNFWVWSMAMNKDSKNKQAAWLFLQYFTGKDFLIYSSTVANNMDPTRQSVWDNKDFQAKIAKLPGWNAAWHATIPNTTILFTPQSAFFDTTTTWAATLQDIVAGKYKTVKAGLDDLKAKMDKQVQE